MSQIPTENEDNRSVANSDFIQLDQPDQMPDQQEAQQQQEQSQNTGRGRNYDNELKEHKWMIANLEVFYILCGECLPIYIGNGVILSVGKASLIYQKK
jgi:hypothetical protein